MATGKKPGPRCPIHSLAASTAYRTRGCRCPVCQGWRNAATARGRELALASGQASQRLKGRAALHHLRSDEGEADREKLADAIASGSKMSEVAQQFGIKPGSLRTLISEYPELQAAKQARADALVEQAGDVLDEGLADRDLNTAHATMRREKVGWLKWQAGVLNRDEWGEKLSVDANVDVSFGALWLKSLEESMEVFKQQQAQQIEEGEVEVIEDDGDGESRVVRRTGY